MGFPFILLHVPSMLVDVCFDWIVPYKDARTNRVVIMRENYVSEVFPTS